MDSPVAQHLRELQVGIGAIGDSPQDGVGRQPLGVAAAVAFARPLGRALPVAVRAFGALTALRVAPTTVVAAATTVVGAAGSSGSVLTHG